MDLLFQSWHKEFDKFWPEQSSEVSKIFTLMDPFWTKCILLELKKVQRSNLSWNWRGMQNLNKNWLVVWKMTWGFWKIFTRALESVKIGTLMGSFCPKLKMCEFKIYRGVMCHNNEEWYINWIGTDLPFSNWHEELHNFWLKHSKKNVLIGFLWPKYIMFELQKYRGVIFHDIEELCKFWRKTGLWFQKWHDEFGKFSPEHLEVSKLRLWWDPFVRSRKGITLKFTKELCVMAMKNNVKFKEELTCNFKTDRNNLTNFDMSTRISKKLAL